MLSIPQPHQLSRAGTKLTNFPFYRGRKQVSERSNNIQGHYHHLAGKKTEAEIICELALETIIKSTRNRIAEA